MQPNGNQLLMIGGILSFAVALLHVGIIIAGAPAYRYFGAGEQMAAWAESGSFLPAIVTLVVVIVITFFGLYAFSGAGLIRQLPLLPIGLAVIAGIYTLRGLAISQQLFLAIKSPDLFVLRELVFSLVPLGIGIIYLLGTLMRWEDMKGDS